MSDVEIPFVLNLRRNKLCCRDFGMEIIMSFFFLKREAKDKLSGVYMRTVLGMLICYFPAYIMALLVSVLAVRQISPIIVLAISLLGEIFIIDILTVGYVRSLLDLDSKPETDEKRYDINLVLSGFTNNYKGTLKTMFTRKLYVFGWSCLIFIPMILAIGVIAFLSIRPEVAELLNKVMQFIQSPTESMAANLGVYVIEKCRYVLYILSGASLLSLILMIPYFRKVYQYEMIPFIMADNPETSSVDAFTKTKEIMHGYRMNYFMLQLSFIGLFIVAGFVQAIIQLNFGIYIVMALIMPYINMTFTQFYLARTRKKDLSEQVSISANDNREDDKDEY